MSMGNYEDFYLSAPTKEDLKTLFGFDFENPDEIPLGIYIDYIGKTLKPDCDYVKEISKLGEGEILDSNIQPEYYEGVLCNVRSLAENIEFNQKIKDSSFVVEVATPIRKWA